MNVTKQELMNTKPCATFGRRDEDKMAVRPSAFLGDEERRRSIMRQLDPAGERDRERRRPLTISWSPRPPRLVNHHTTLGEFTAVIGR